MRETKKTYNLLGDSLVCEYQVLKGTDIYDGYFREWWRKYDQAYIDCYYSNGNKHGLYKEWHSNGILAQSCTFQNGKLTGVYEDWYKDGRPWEYSHHLNGMLHGLHILCHRMTQEYVAYSMFFEGLQHGEKKRCDIKGNICLHVIYQDDILTDITPPITDEQRFIFKLEYGLPLLPLGEHRQNEKWFIKAIT